MPDRPAPPQRADSSEIVALRRLREEQPDLASAIDLQIELLQIQRRIQTRVPLPSINLESAALDALLAHGSILQFEQLPIEWSDVRFLLRATAQAMQKHDAIDDADVVRVELLCRDATRLPAMIRSWYDAERPGGGTLDAEGAGLVSLIQQAMRPILTRCAEAIMARTDFSAWDKQICPLCAGEPDLAVITPSAQRLLVCGRCAARWKFDQIACPFCLNEERTKITSLASRDGKYRVSCCDVCRRYIKAYDARRAGRPLMPSVDSVATLPLDAAAIQRGYH